jgi:hypothetical protein
MPEDAVAALERGIETKNIDIYIGAFSDSTSIDDIAFHALFDPQDILDYEVATGAEPPSDWQTPDERRFFPFLAGLRPVNYQVDIYPDSVRTDENITPDQEVLLFRHYRVRAVGDLVAIGAAELRVNWNGDDGEWEITRWADSRDTSAIGESTMGKRRLHSLAFQ